MEFKVCDVCGASRTVPFLHRLDRFSGKSFEYVSCAECRLISLDPQPTPSELVEYYPAEYEAYQTVESGRSTFANWRRRRGLDVQVNFVERFAPQRGRLLDIGCGPGNFLDRARARGWSVAGVEWVEQAACVARDHYGLTVTVSSGEETHLPGGENDVVTLWDVLEHVPHPKKMLLECRRLLTPSGMLVFSVPNLDSFSRYLFGRAWIGWDAPRHLHLFSEEVIERLLAMTGFEMVQHSCILGEEGAFALSLESMGHSKKLKQVIGLATTGLWPYRQVAYSLNKGAIMTFAAQKKGI